MDVEKITVEFVNFINQKEQLNTAMLPLLKEKDRQKIIEIIVENTVDDIFMYGKLRYLVGSDPSEPLSDKDREIFKKKLFDIMD